LIPRLIQDLMEGREETFTLKRQWELCTQESQLLFILTGVLFDPDSYTILYIYIYISLPIWNLAEKDRNSYHALSDKTERGSGRTTNIMVEVH
jgi:hypothetical protein